MRGRGSRWLRYALRFSQCRCRASQVVWFSPGYPQMQVRTVAPDSFLYRICGTGMDSSNVNG